ncbi:response regulator [soil metagenome]
MPKKHIPVNMKKCVLIYDDDESILFLCKAILLKNNYRVETMSHTDDVVNDIALLKPDIILMDLWIPQIGGEVAIGIIKDNPATKHIPVIVFSANSDIKEISKNIHAEGYLEKPFNIELLKETIEKHINDHRGK